MPSVWVRCEERLRATALGTYSSSRIARSTRSRVSAVTLSWPLITLETVWCETRARRATSRMVGPFTCRTLPAPRRGSHLTIAKTGLCYRSHLVPGALMRHGEGGPDVGYLTPKGADRSRRHCRHRRGRTNPRRVPAHEDRRKRQGGRHDRSERVQRRRSQDPRSRHEAQDRSRPEQPNDSVRDVGGWEPARRLPGPGGGRAAVHLAEDGEEPPAVLREQQAPQAGRPRAGEQLLQVGWQDDRHRRPLRDGEGLVTRLHAIRVHQSL